MVTVLVIWTLVGFAGTQYSTHPKYDWRQLAEFHSPAACKEAAKNLSITHFRCLDVMTGEVK